MPKQKILASFMAMAIAVAITLCGGVGSIAFARTAAGNAGDTDPSPASALASGALAAQSQTSATATAKTSKPTKKQLAAFKKSSADFSIELFKRSVAAKGRNANVTIAPLSVMNALALTANGAAGKTRAQMSKVLAGGASMARLNKNLSWYNGKLVNVKRARLNNANSIWYRNDGTIAMKKGFLRVARKTYGAKVSAADFSSKKTVDNINKWVSDNTNGMIKHVLSQLSPQDRIVIVNALGFDAKWKAPFDAHATTTQKFTNAKGQKRKVKMMHGAERKYIAGNNVTGFVKPYAKGYSYVALLPKKGLSLKKYVASLSGDEFRRLVAGATDANVVVALPKQSLSYSNDSMENQLAAMGMKAPFARSADFSKMASDRKGKLYIGQVVHRTRVDVDEEGTKAAAVTAVLMKTSSARIGDVKRVTLNRPFVYAIIDNSTKLPVFIGTVNDVK